MDQNSDDVEIRHKLCFWFVT